MVLLKSLIKLVQNRGLEMELETAEDLSNFFDKTICFEPNLNCIDCLKKNINFNFLNTIFVVKFNI